jgi:hypothetical protein
MNDKMADKHHLNGLEIAAEHSNGDIAYCRKTPLCSASSSSVQPRALVNVAAPTGKSRADQRAETILGFGDTGLLHNGPNSLIEVSLQATNVVDPVERAG